jgi:hypothetical protein
MRMASPVKGKRTFLVWYLIGFCLFLVLARFVYYHGKPERVREITPYTQTGSYSVFRSIQKNGQEYWATDGADGSVIHARPITGGQERQIVHEDPKVRISDNGMTVTEKEIFYGLIMRPKPIQYGTGGSFAVGGSISSTIFEGAFRAVPGKPTADQAIHEKRRTLPKITSQEVPHLRLRRVPIGGGAAEDIAEIESLSPTIAGDYAYWIRSRPDDTVLVIDRNREHSEVTGHSDLMVTPLKGGPSRRLYTGITTWFGSLFAGADGVYWTEPHPYPDRTRDLYHIRAADTQPRVVANSTGVSGLTEYGGRLYWVANEDRSDVQDGYLRKINWVKIESMRLDGSDRRTVLSEMETGASPRMPPQIYRDHLYMILADFPRQEKAPDKPRPLRLCRIHPENADTVETICTLPAVADGFHFAGDYLYFSVVDRGRSLWASLTDDNSVDKYTRVLYRVPLTH